MIAAHRVVYLFDEPDSPEVQNLVATIDQQVSKESSQDDQAVQPGQIVITPAGAGDLIGLRNLQKRCFSGGQAFGVVTLGVFHLWPRSRVLIARQGEDIVGCVIGDLQRDQGRVLNICVDPAYRRRGLGSALLDTVEHILDHDNMTLTVEDKNVGAQALYRQHGYLPAGDLRDYYGRNRHGVLMQKRRVRQPTGSRPGFTVLNGREEE